MNRTKEWLEQRAAELTKPGQIVVHFKHHFCSEEEKRRLTYMYEVLGVGWDAETGERVVCYRALYGDRKLYTRPYDRFVSEVDHNVCPDANQRFRFETLRSAAG